MEDSGREVNEKCINEIRNQLAMLYAGQIGREVKRIRIKGVPESTRKKREQD